MQSHCNQKVIVIASLMTLYQSQGSSCIFAQKQRPSRFSLKKQKVYQTNFGALRATNRARYQERQDRESGEEESKDIEDDMNVDNRR